MSPKQLDERAAEAHLLRQGFTVDRDGDMVLVTGRGFSVRAASLLGLVRHMDRRDPPRAGNRGVRA